MSLPMLDEASLDDLYQWLDSLPLSRPRKNITRDFSDGGKKICFSVSFLFHPIFIELKTLILVST